MVNEAPAPRRPSPLGRFLLWSVPALAGLAALVGSRFAAQDAAVAEAAERLHRGDVAGARSLLEPLATSMRHGRQASAGMALARALAGEAGGEAGVAGHAEALRSWPIRPLLDAAIGRGDVEGARGLAALAARAGEPIGPAYEAAALVESGDVDGARAALGAAGTLTDGFARRVARAIELRAAGVRTVVLDRRGGILGAVDGAGAFAAEADVPAGWVPPSVATASAAIGPAARTALDRRLSALAAKALGTYRGTIVLVDVRTGDVVAAATDPATAAREPDAAFRQQREPASISKIITSTAAQRAGLDPDREIAQMTCAGSARYDAGTLWCAYPGGRLTGLPHALAISCNVAFANLGLRLGRTALLDELRRFGFDRGDLVGAGRIREPEGDERQLADLSVGLTGTEITPVHGAFLAAVFAREGRMPEPRLVVARDTALGRSPAALPLAEPRAVVEPGQVPAILRAMAAVTGPGGTAEGAAPPSFPVAMKTGTASEPGLGYHVNYIGVGPLPAPDLAFSIRVTGQPSSRSVTAAAREVLFRLLEGLGARGR